jgi:hypothetical protein
MPVIKGRNNAWTINNKNKPLKRKSEWTKYRLTVLKVINVRLKPTLILFLLNRKTFEREGRTIA